MDTQELVRALYDDLGRWQAVADACNRDGRRHSAGYYWSIANGKIRKPDNATRRGIVAAARERLPALSSPMKGPTRRVARGGIAITRNLWNRLYAVRIRDNLTWDELAEKALASLE